MRPDSAIPALLLLASTVSLSSVIEPEALDAQVARGGSQGSPVGTSVVFGEIMWMGSESSVADEWLELYNPGDEAVDVTGWSITRLVKGSHQVMVELGEARIPAGGVFLIANYGPGEARCALAVEPDLTTTSVALANSRLQLRLLSGSPTAEATAVVDRADDGRGTPAAGGTDPPASMVRVDPAADGAEPRAWATATVASGWKAGSAELGTPGSPPDPPAGGADRGSATAASAVPWADLKRARAAR